MRATRRPLGAVLSLACAALALFAADLASLAQTYPSRPVRLIVPYAAGGPTDLAARHIAEALRPHLGQSVVVENRGGAGGIPGTEAVVQAAPDGYTLLVGAAGPLVVSPSVKKLRYDVEKDLAPIAEIWRSAQVLAVNPKLGVTSVRALVDYAKKNPGKVNAGSAGNGTLPHLSIVLANTVAGIDIAHVPYRGTSAAVPNLISGQIQAMFGDAAVLAPNIRSGALVALAVTSPRRSTLLPDTPTMAEAGYPQLVAESWYGLLAPAGLDPAVFQKIASATQAALKEPAFVEALKQQGATVESTTPDAFRALIREEAKRWGPVAKLAGLQ
jgi:tripartite-type tricarboxylate transporter receptor subunit TctC